MQIKVCKNNGRMTVANAWIEFDLTDRFACDAAQEFGLKVQKITNANGQAFHYRAFTDVKTARSFVEYCE